MSAIYVPCDQADDHWEGLAPELLGAKGGPIGGDKVRNAPYYPNTCIFPPNERGCFCGLNKLRGVCGLLFEIRMDFEQEGEK